MTGIWSIFLLSLVHLGASTCHHKKSKPHIIFVVADDLGWNDVGFHNPAIWTPNIDHAAHNGIILNYSYVQDICTPSRSTFMTGYFPYRTGMQYFVIPFFAQYGLPLQFKLLPQVLKGLGYSTNMIGKWHLGSCNPKYLPTNRGFDTFFGFLGGAEHFYTHSYPLTDDNVAMSKPGLVEVYDLWNQTTVSLEYNNTYSAIPFMTQLQTILANRKPNVPLYLYLPFQETHAPIEVGKDNFFWYSKEENPYRKGFSSLATQLDYNFGQMIKMLKDYGIYDESIIIFTADNGGETLSGGNNYPLRGGKFTMYEGGTRASAFIHSPLLKRKGFTYNGLIHAVDWYRTIVALAGGTPDPEMDGLNVWPAIVNNLTSPRTGFVYNMVDNGDGKLQGAIRHGKWKLIFGDPGLPNTQVRPENVTGQLYSACGGLELPDANGHPFQLYNIHDDPTESDDLAYRKPSVVAELQCEVNNYRQKMVKAVHLASDVTLYRNLTQDLRILNTNWCTPIDNLNMRLYPALYQTFTHDLSILNTNWRPTVDTNSDEFRLFCTGSKTNEDTIMRPFFMMLNFKSNSETENRDELKLSIAIMRLQSETHLIVCDQTMEFMPLTKRHSCKPWFDCLTKSFIDLIFVVHQKTKCGTTMGPNSDKANSWPLNL